MQADIQPSPIRILALIEATTVTGPAKNLLMLAQKLAGAGTARIQIVTFTRDQKNTAFLDAFAKGGVEVDLIKERYRFDPGVIPQLREIVRRRVPHIIQSHNQKSHFIIRLSGVHRDIPWIAFNHGYTAEDLKMKLYNQIDRWSLRGADRVVAVCGAFAAALHGWGVSESRLVVRHNAVAAMPPASPEEIVQLRASLGIPAGAQVLLTVGRLSPEKGHADLIRAVSTLRNRRSAPDFRLVVLGAGPEEGRLRELCGKLAVSDLVIWAGTTDSVARYYSLADIFVLPSHSEGSPNALLEAMMNGTAVVATAVGGVPEIAQPGVNGLLVEARNPAAMASRIADLLPDQELKNRLGERARERMILRHSREEYVESMLALYRESVGLRVSTRPADPAPLSK